jgi:GNAT superfamily N-acetyltransferase
MVKPEYAEALQALELLSFPTINPRDLTSVESVEMQCKKFPEGGFVVLDGENVVGFAMGIFVDFDLDHPQHHIDEAVGPTGSEFHDPHGEWYYGTDIAVSPAYRGRGIGRKLYDLRKQLVRDHNRAGIIAGGVIPGYADHKTEMTADEYIEKVAAGELFDSTLSFQLANGFEARGAIGGYMTDSAVDDWASFIVWPNPDHDPEALRREKAAAAGSSTS